MPAEIKRGRWRTRQAERPVRGTAYRRAAPDRRDRPPPAVEQSGRYQALREHWLRALLRRLLRRG